jgi:hypothetical protein
MANELTRSSLSLSLVALALAACGGTTETTPSGTTSGDSSSASTTGSGGSGGGGGGSGGNGTTATSSSASSSAGTGGSADPAMFRYAPSWPGVTAVTVIGGFGLATDWDPKQPYATLTKGADGAWTAPVSLPDGSYPYLFQVTGDDSATAGFNRYAMDGATSAFVPCPAASPTYNLTNSNPCSQLTLPLAPPDALHHVKGVVTFDGAGIAGYLVQLDREEPMSHHFFEDRTVTAPDGSFDLVTAAASVRIQVLHPTYLSKTDAQRDPLALAALRRAISSSVQIDKNVKLGPVEVAYHDYPQTLPVGMATLPTTLQITVIPGYTQARASVYGSAQAMFKSIGDPWFSSAYGVATAVPFDGTFNTKKATEMAVKPGEKYFWGTWQRGAAAPAGGVQWEGESMVFPIVWQ